MTVPLTEQEPPLSFALFSGGHDSLCATHYAMSNGFASEVVHVNTTIGIEQTRQFVRDTCAEHGWTLNEITPPFSFEQLMMERGWTRARDGGRHYGFPGPGMHSVTYRMLKERALAAFARERKPYRGAKVTYLTGVRVSESDRRMAHVKQWQPAPKLGWTWFAPIWDWTKIDCNRYIAEQGLRRNEVVDLLHMSGECLCGAYAKRKVERAQLAEWFPEADAEIAALEARVDAAGHPARVWGQRPPNVHRLQLRFDEGGMLCASCGPGVAA